MERGGESDGLSTAASALVIVSVFALVLLGMVALDQRARAVARSEATAGAPDPATQGPMQTPLPAPGADAPGTYTVREGDSLFSVAADLGLDPDALVYWNRDTYPTLQTTPALRPGWILATTGPPPPTPMPDPTAAPTPASPPAQVAGTGVTVYDAADFPASDAVTVSYYAVSGFTPREIVSSMRQNGPWSEWLGRRAQAAVQVQPTYDFTLRRGIGGCSVELHGGDPVSITYEVTLPQWTPPANVSPGTVRWWEEMLAETVAHEGHHISLYEAQLPAMIGAVVRGSCESVPEALEELWTVATRANCEFDVADYGAESGLTVESCVTGG